MNATTIILNFHGIGEPVRPFDPGEDDVWLGHDRFLEIIGRVPRDGSVEITFDDGNVSDLTLAAPALAEHGLSACFFVVAGRIGQPGFLSGADIRTLLDLGMEIGSHGMHHRSWKGLGAEAALEEIFEAKRLIEAAADRTVRKAACPFGTYDRISLDYLRQAGFSTVYTSDRGIARRSQWLKARNTVRRNDDADLMARLRAEAVSRPLVVARAARRLVKRSRPLWGAPARLDELRRQREPAQNARTTSV